MISTSDTPARGNTSNPAHSEIVYRNFLQALRSGDFVESGRIIEQALEAGLSAAMIYDRVFAPSLRQVGSLWEGGQMTVAQEHLATGITEYCRTLVVNQPVATSAARSGRVLLANVSGNQHTLGINLLCDVFRWHGWQVFPLITPIPEEQLAQAAILYRVDLVCLSVALPAQIPRVTSTIKALRQSNWKGLIEVGGPAFVNNTAAAQLTGADFLGEEAEATVQQAARMLLAGVGKME